MENCNIVKKYIVINVCTSFHSCKIGEKTFDESLLFGKCTIFWIFHVKLFG